MTISNPDIVRVIETRLTDCRCYGLPVDPAGFKPCGGCEHDKNCLDEIVRLRADLCEAQRERDEARRMYFLMLKKTLDSMELQPKA